MFDEPLCSDALSLTMSTTDSWALFSAALTSTGLANSNCWYWIELMLAKSSWATECHPLSKNGTHSPQCNCNPACYHWVAAAQLCSVYKTTWKSLTPKKNSTPESGFRIPKQIISEQKMASIRTEVIPVYPNGYHIFNKNLLFCFQTKFHSSRKWLH